MPLDEPFARAAAGIQLQAAVAVTAACAASKQAAVMHIAEKFKNACVDQEKNAEEKQRRLMRKEEQQLLRSSHALRQLDRWLDEQ